MPSLPSLVLFFIPTRTGKNRFVLMNAVYDQSAWVLTPLETLTIITIVSENTTAAKFGMLVVRNHDGIPLNKHIKTHPGMVITKTNNEVIPVISTSLHTTVFGPHALKSNVVLAEPNIADNAINHVGDNNTNMITTDVSGNIVIKAKKRPVPAGKGLEKFVAKQLLDLAILRKEMCPITAEEFSEGNTAVMPCGHLFMQFAIEESFKKEKDKCPWCRQMGAPTYV